MSNWYTLIGATLVLLIFAVVELRSPRNRTLRRLEKKFLDTK